MPGILGAMLIRLLLAAVVLASPRVAFERLAPAISKEVAAPVRVRVDRVVGDRVDFEVSFSQGRPERFVGYADHGRVSWMTACFVREFYGRLCGTTPHGVSNEPLPQAVLPARFAHPKLPGLISPGPLAIAPDGSLLIVDTGRGELFRRSPDGALHLVMPTTSDAIAVAPDGSIYLADGGRVQVRAPKGSVRVLAPRFGEVRSLALASNGTLYVGASQSLDALAPNGRVRTILRGVGKFNQLVVGKKRYGGFNADEIAVGGNGDIFVYSNDTKTVAEVTPAGKSLRVWSTYAHGLAAAPDGSIVIGTQEGTVQRLHAGRLSTIVELASRQPFGFPFQEDGVAVGSGGTIYTDTDIGNGYTDQTALAEVDPDAVAHLLHTTTPLAATLPGMETGCPSLAGLRAFDSAAHEEAIRIAQTVDIVPFARGLQLTDRSWWTGFYTYQIDGRYQSGRHHVYSVGPAAADQYSSALVRRCGAALVRNSLAIVVGRGVYSDQVSHMFFLDRNGRALLYWQHT
ncbi:MAG: hypothetical protein ACRDLE_12510 [Gaiellaceae bacterium]